MKNEIQKHTVKCKSQGAAAQPDVIDRSSILSRGQGLFFSPPRSDPLWTSPSLLRNGYGGGGVKLPEENGDYFIPPSVELKNV